MAVFFLGFLIIALSILGLAVGLFFGRATLTGSCGGIACTACRRCPRKNNAPADVSPGEVSP